MSAGPQRSRANTERHGHGVGQAAPQASPLEQLIHQNRMMQKELRHDRRDPSPSYFSHSGEHGRQPDIIEHAQYNHPPPPARRESEDQDPGTPRAQLQAPNYPRFSTAISDDGGESFRDSMISERSSGILGGFSFGIGGGGYDKRMPELQSTVHHVQLPQVSSGRDSIRPVIGHASDRDSIHSVAGVRERESMRPFVDSVEEVEEPLSPRSAALNVPKTALTVATPSTAPDMASMMGVLDIGTPLSRSPETISDGPHTQLSTRPPPRGQPGRERSASQSSNREPRRQQLDPRRGPSPRQGPSPDRLQGYPPQPIRTDSSDSVRSNRSFQGQQPAYVQNRGERNGSPTGLRPSLSRQSSAESGRMMPGSLSRQGSSESGRMVPSPMSRSNSSENGIPARQTSQAERLGPYRQASGRHQYYTTNSRQVSGETSPQQQYVPFRKGTHGSFTQRDPRATGAAPHSPVPSPSTAHGFAPMKRTPSAASDASVHTVGGTRVAPGFNFSRPMANRPPSQGGPTIDIPQTPVEGPHGGEPTTPGGSTYVYSRFVLPRGRDVDRGSVIFQDGDSHAVDSLRGAAVPTENKLRPQQSPPRPKSQQAPAAAKQSPPPMLGVPIPRNASSAPASPGLPSPGIPSPKPTTPKPSTAHTPASSATQLTADEHLDRGIKLHEDGKLQESTYHLRLAANGGHPTGMLLYALACRHGWGMRPNQREGVTWLKKVSSIVQGDLHAMEKNGGGAFFEKQAMKAQFALSIYELGVSHLNGWGTEIDKPLALNCFEIAAKWGDPDALSEAGFCYANGVGTKKDLKKAAGYYRAAEAKGVNMVGNSWIWKDKYLDDEARKAKAEKEGTVAKKAGGKVEEKGGLFGRKKSTAA